ncbi:MAG: glycosyl hydrolase, partial [Crocinitomicaceae bacterium]|nr:glycosyl hydrolase [Crocinitomicaceae bacterium]
MKNALQRCVRKSTALFILACGFANATNAQQSNWVDALNAPNANYAAVKQAFYSDWDGISYKKGHGWKQFHRWEAFWETRLMPDGSFPNFKQAYNEHKGYMSSHGLAKNGQNAGNWQPLGPFSYTNTQSWSPGMGRVNFVMEDPNTPTTLYIGAPAGGIWKSTDSGLNWTPLGDELAVMGVSAIGISAANSNTIYLATGDADGGDTYSIGVLKSIDAGLTWNEVGNLNGNLRDVIVDPANENIAYVASNGGLYKTTNGGNTWNL